MVDEASPPRRRGRPKKAPEDVTRRPNFSLRVRQEIYDDLTAKAHASGRSISEEAESRLEHLFSDAPANALKAAIAEAAEAARNAEFEKIQEEFGGQLPMMFSSIFADAFNAELRKATAGESNPAALFADERRLKDFGQALSGHIPGALNAVIGLASIDKMIAYLNKLEKDDPAEFEKLRAQINQMGEARAARRAKKSKSD